VNKGTALVIDDDPALLGLIAAYLTRLGYDVETSRSSQRALSRFQERPAAYALVVTDARLPDLPGRDLLLKMIEVKHDLRAVLSSGMPVEPIQVPEGVPARVEFLQKPYRAADLERVVDSLFKS
jgi:DNA-binding NtrC family response regulator